MLKDFSFQASFMGLLAAFVGFTSSFAIVLQGLTAVGATELQAASGLFALSMAMGIAGILLSVIYRMPISAAWSTPGAALLVTSGVVEGGFAGAVGAFLICNIMIVIAGLWKPLGVAVSKIPSSIANAMLAGVLVNLCLAPVKAIAFDPALGLPILIAWIVVGRFNKLFAVPAAFLAFILVLIFGVDIPEDATSQLAASIAIPTEFVWPEFSVSALIGIALPLFLVTMASQNIPGVAVLKVNGFEPKPGPLFAWTGGLSLISAPFGGHGINLAAITAALCAGLDANKDPAKRYWAAIMSGVGYVVFGLFAGVVTTLVGLAPSILLHAVAGLALIGAFSTSAMAAFKEAGDREAAAVTFLFTASGISFWGISGAFWGLIAGGLVYLFTHREKKEV
ncbi:benzoate/H(+) symporter BenE family transporter [Curvivirga aplysinae]|uniref:benzoate/H(+) symporter BenE family transporter n=1 Tax=Curvivirga aplysinae TaxID=2529852 RepID=UPI0012BBC0E2|nr:benzoate/H(+) symporter BenE family transporter [Curvivirga aplysinae]MTI08245.1 benzoate transporter BenE [Curvivirga aplysinae]